VITLDLPGFGGSARLPATTRPGAVALADAAERETDQLGTGDFHAAGYSLGARVSPELAARGRIRSVVAIAPDGPGAPPERAYQATALTAGRTMATRPAPVAAPATASGPGRSLFSATERSRPRKLTRQDARQLLPNLAPAPAYQETVLATMADIPAGRHRITSPVLIMQGTADPRTRHRTHARFPQHHSAQARPAGIPPSTSVTRNPRPRRRRTGTVGGSVDVVPVT
jgi:pimeloyl-ACP methyl ester carboxylesterase